MSQTSAPIRRRQPGPLSTLAVLFLGACSSPAPGPRPVVQVAWQAPIPSFLPNASTSVAVVDFAALVYEGLAAVDDSGRVGPGLARAWTTADAQTFRFRLRTGVRFHDGRPFTSADVVRAWKTALGAGPGSPEHPWQLAHIKGALAFSARESDSIPGLRPVDDSTLDIELESPLAPFPATLTHASAAIPGVGSTADSAIGTGPWRLVHGKPRDSTYILAANLSHWRSRPTLDSLIIRVVGPGQVGPLLDRELIDCIPYAWGITSLRLRPDIALRESPPYTRLTIGLNHRNPVLQDHRVRRALQIALDAEGLARAYGETGYHLAQSALPPGMVGLEPTTAPARYDPDSARKLLREAGHDRGTSLRLWFEVGSPTDTLTHLIRFVRDNLEAVGLSIEIVRVSPFEAPLLDGRVDLAIGYWLPGYPDPDALLHPFYHSQARGGLANAGGFFDPALDRAIDAERSLPDGPARLAALRAAGQLAFEQLPELYLWFQPVKTAAARRVDHCPASLHVTDYARVGLAGPSR